MTTNEELKKEISFILDHEERISSDKEWKYSELVKLLDRATQLERERILDKMEEELRWDDKTGMPGSGYLIAAKDFNKALDTFIESEKGEDV